MTQAKEYSSLPIAISIASVICLSAAGGWFLLRQDPAAQADATAAGNETMQTEQRAASVPIDLDAELRKARLAADADFIMSPPGRNAFYYYERVLLADPNHQLAIAELGVVLTRVPQIVSDYLAAGDYVSAYNVAARIAAGQPEHPVGQSLRERLDDYVNEMAAQAEEAAESGNEDRAAELLSTLEQLPGLNSQYLAASQESVLGKMQQVRDAAAQQSLNEQRLAEERSVSEWTRSVREAIASGQLIAPAGNSARDLLAARKTPVDARKQLTKEFLAALMASSEESLDQDYLAAVETYLNSEHDLAVASDTAETDVVEGDLASDDLASADLTSADLASADLTVAENPAIDTDSDDEAELQTDNPVAGNAEAADAEPDEIIEEALKNLRGTIEKQLVAAEGQRVLGLADFVRIRAAPAEYPFIAGERNITGWVDVEFTVTTSGETAAIEVRRAEPADVFESSAIAAVRDWTFEPRQFRGQPIDQRTVARLVFELQ